MDKFAFFLLGTVSDFLVLALLLRFIMRANNIKHYHPIIYGVAKITNPLTAPFNRVFQLSRRWDWNAILVAILIKMLSLFLLFEVLKVYIAPSQFNPLTGYLFLGIGAVLELMTTVAFWVVIITALLSWFVNGHNPHADLLFQLADFFLRPIRQLMPDLGGLDLSPIVALLAIKAIEFMLLPVIRSMAVGELPW